MARNHDRRTLSEAERLSILQKYRAGDQTYQQLADEYGVHKSTISRIVKGQNKKLQRAEAAQTVVESHAGVEHDPLLFRQAKLIEIAQDIQATRDRGSQHALPQFHRLHLQVHDEWVQMKRDAEELDGVTNPDDLLRTIAMTVNGLPPILKDKLIDMLSGQILTVYDGGAS